MDLVASSGDFILSLSSRSPQVCRATNQTVIFLSAGTCTVQVMSGGAVMHTFSTRVQAVTTAASSRDSESADRSRNSGSANRRQGSGANNSPELKQLRSQFVYFGPESAVLTPQARATLRRLVTQLRTAAAVSVTGDAADDGDRDNRAAAELSRRRTRAVAEFLLERGVDVTIRESFGKERPVSTTRSPNRRVEIAWYSE